MCPERDFVSAYDALSVKWWVDVIENAFYKNGGKYKNVIFLEFVNSSEFHVIDIFIALHLLPEEMRTTEMLHQKIFPVASVKSEKSFSDMISRFCGMIKKTSDLSVYSEVFVKNGYVNLPPNLLAAIETMAASPDEHPDFAARYAIVNAIMPKGTVGSDAGDD